VSIFGGVFELNVVSSPLAHFPAATFSRIDSLSSHFLSLILLFVKLFFSPRSAQRHRFDVVL